MIFTSSLCTDFSLIMRTNSTPDFVGATSGRPPKSERILRIIDLSAHVTKASLVQREA